MNKYVVKNSTWNNITVVLLLCIIVGLLAMRDAEKNLAERQLWECMNSGKSWNEQFEFHYESYRSTDDDYYTEVLDQFE